MKRLKSDRLSHLAHGETFPTETQRRAREDFEAAQEKATQLDRRTIGGVDLEAVRYTTPVPHWRIKVTKTGRVISSGVFKNNSRPAMWADAEHIARLRGDELWQRDMLADEKPPVEALLYLNDEEFVRLDKQTPEVMTDENGEDYDRNRVSRFHTKDTDIRICYKLDPAPMPKNYNLQQNIGKCKYVLNFHDGSQTHKDGSPFYDCMIFRNKTALAAYIKKLEAEGYIPTPNQ